MKSSMMVAASAAMVAMASPVEKRKLETSWVMQYYTVTVTGTETEPTSTAKPVIPHEMQRSTSEAPSVVVVTVTPSAPAPAPEPTTTQPSVVVVTATETPKQAAPASTSTPAVQQSSPSSDTSSEPNSDDFVSAAVYHHNIHRSNNSSPDVSWSDKLAGYASNTAATCKMVHDMDQGDKGYGQNLADWALSSGAFELGAAGAVKMAVSDYWYNGEINSFRPEYYGQATPDMSNFESWGHYSQLVWKESTQIGCASQYCEKGTMYTDFDAWFTVCNYSPQGNMNDGYGKNVLKPLGKSTVAV
ncbi:PR-1-like protein [Hypoxylon fuscum]|nr:PR-1-like protein [Hypoxylon fuscum]